MTLEAYTGGHDEVLALRREQGRSLLSSPSFSRDIAYSHSPTASRAASLDGKAVARTALVPSNVTSSVRRLSIGTPPRVR